MAHINKPEQTISFDKPRSFTIDKRVQLMLDEDLALIVGDIIMASQPTNPAVQALGIQLQYIKHE